MSIPAQYRKPVIGISCGDVNGIGPEIIIKSLIDNRILDFCTPVIFGNNKIINFYRKSIPDCNFTFSNVDDLSKLNPKQANIFNCWEGEVPIHPGEVTDAGGKYAVKSLMAAADALKKKQIDALVTAPLHKKNAYSDEFPFTGHTPFLEAYFGEQEAVMLMSAGDFRVGLVTEHIPVSQIASSITREGIVRKLTILNASLKKDFDIEKPKIAVLALNPHAGDAGLVGSEEEEIIKPAVNDARQQDILAIGPYAADGFFARGYQYRFDAVLAMYHDQGLIPFKSLAQVDGINFTAGLEIIRTSPDHGTAFDIAGENRADPSSFLAAIFEAIDIYNRRNFYEEIRLNPLKKLSAAIYRGSHDEH